MREDSARCFGSIFCLYRKNESVWHEIKIFSRQMQVKREAPGVKSEELCAGYRWSDDPCPGIKRDNRLFFDAVLGDQAGQIGPLDAHHCGGFALIAAGVPEVYLNKLFFKIVNRILQGHSVANAFNAGLGV